MQTLFRVERQIPLLFEETLIPFDIFMFSTFWYFYIFILNAY